MSQIEVQLITQPYRGAITTNNLVDPSDKLNIPGTYEVVTGLEIPGIASVYNGQHSDHLDAFEQQGIPRPGDSIMLQDEAAIALSSAFSRLHPGHQIDCHEFLAAVTGWERAGGGLACSQAVVGSNETVVSGVPYAVIAQTYDANGWSRTHSGFGTSQGRLLSVMGKGSLLTVVDRLTAQYAFSNGGRGYLSQAFPPSYARRFRGGLVPATPSYDYVER